jgi:predicted RNA binding protein YcfA (HicA-like mRNA interferase family)
MRDKPPISAKEVIKVLTKKFGFFIVSQKGSHIKLKKKEIGGEKTTIVSNHKELAAGTLKGILDLANITEKDFWNIYIK